MALNDDGGANNSRKRKMKDTEQIPTNPPDLFNLRGQPLVAPPGVPSMYNQPSLSGVQRILNTAAPFKHFPYTALLTAPDLQEEKILPFLDLWNPGQQIDQIISSSNETLRNTLLGMVEKLAEERAAKKLKEKDVEVYESKREAEHYKKEAYKLNDKAEHYKKEATKLFSKVKALERNTESLKKSMEITNAVRISEEQSESSFVNPDNVGPVRLDCKVCVKQVATVMMWPCRHVCVCVACDGVTKTCPVCSFPKTTSVEVCLPHNN